MGVLDDIKNNRNKMFGQAAQQVQQQTEPVQQTTGAQKPQDVVAGVMRGQQEQMRAGRHQYAADPYMRALSPFEGPQQSGGTVNQAAPSPLADPDGVKVDDMDGLLGYLNKKARERLDEADETPEQKAAREKREKREKLMATIGDGLGAFHEAYSHQRDLKPMTSGGSMSAAQEARARALGLQRDKSYSDALANYIKVMNLAATNEYRQNQQKSIDRDREERRKLQAEKNQAYIKLQEAKRQNELEKSDYYTAYLEALNSGADKATAELFANQEVVRLSKAREAQDAAVAESKVKANEARVHQSNTAAAKNQAQANKTNASGSGGGTTTTTQEKVTYDKRGNVKGKTVTTTTKSRGGGGGRRSGNRGRGNSGGGGGRRHRYGSVRLNNQ